MLWLFHPKRSAGVLFCPFTNAFSLLLTLIKNLLFKGTEPTLQSR